VTAADLLVADPVFGAPGGLLLGNERHRQRRALPGPERGATPVFPPGQEPRPDRGHWPQTTMSRTEVETHVFGVAGGTQDAMKVKLVGVRRVLDWLEAQPGGSWQQRWRSSGADASGRDWVDLVPLGTGRHGGGTAKPGTIRAGLVPLLLGQVVCPSMAWLLAQNFSQTLRRAFEVIDPDGLMALRRAAGAEQ
jgi:hypothetical protein